MREREEYPRMSKEQLIAEKKDVEEKLAKFIDPQKDHAYNFFFYLPKHSLERRIALLSDLIDQKSNQ